MRARRVVAAAAATVAVGCNAILGIEQKPLRADDAGGVHAASDDGGPSAHDGDARATSPCGPTSGATLVFCDAFDDGAATPAGRWDALEIGAGTVGFDATEAVSPPRSLRFDLAAGGGSRTSAMTKAVATTKQDVTVAFDVRLDGPTSADFGAIAYARIELRPPPPGKQSRAISLFQFDPGPLTVEYDEDPASTSTPPRGEVTLAPGKWQRVALTIALDAASPVASATVDGALGASVPVASVPIEGVSVTLGFDTAEARTTATIRFDDVTVEER